MLKGETGLMDGGWKHMELMISSHPASRTSASSCSRSAVSRAYDYRWLLLSNYERVSLVTWPMLQTAVSVASYPALPAFLLSLAGKTTRCISKLPWLNKHITSSRNASLHLNELSACLLWRPEGDARELLTILILNWRLWLQYNRDMRIFIHQ